MTAKHSTLTRPTGIPDADPSSWGYSADWSISGDDSGFILENVATSEVLYAEADQFSVSEYQRSVFTLDFNQTYEEVPDSALWTFSKNLSGSNPISVNFFAVLLSQVLDGFK